MARPKNDTPTGTITVRLPLPTVALIARAAKAGGITRSAWMAGVLTGAAEGWDEMRPDRPYVEPPEAKPLRGIVPRAFAPAVAKNLRKRDVDPIPKKGGK